MIQTQSRPAFGGMLFFMATFTLGSYFAFAAIQGDYGVFRRVQINAEAAELRSERDQLAAELARVRNLTKRLSDGYLDIDLLDEQLRDVLGYLRTDEVVVR